MKPIVKELDDLAYAVVDKRSMGMCELCGETEGLSRHHMYGRGKMVRWETEGIMLICTFNKTCPCDHEEAEKDRKAFQDKYGNDRLYVLSKMICYDPDYDGAKRKLLNELDKYKDNSMDFCIENNM